MKKILFILLTVVLYAPVGLTAQKMYMQSGKIVLDMTNTGEGIGLPAEAVTSTPKYFGVTAVDNSNWLINATDNLPTGTINATMYEKLEIAPQDLGTSGLGAGAMTMLWDAAFNDCINCTYDGGGWRLPTQRELLMMWIFRTKINDFSGTSFGAGYYWSATEGDADYAWSVNFNNGATNINYSKSYYSYRVRCVREL